MEVKPWIRMGCERREVTFGLTEAEIEMVGDQLESFIEQKVTDWIDCRYGWGWSCDLMTKDFGWAEDSSSVVSEFVNEILNPRTGRKLVTPRSVLLSSGRCTCRNRGDAPPQN